MALNWKKILLIHPLGYGADTLSKRVARLALVTPPTGLVSLAAYLEKQGFQADVMDLYAIPRSDEQIGEYLKREQPGFVGISCTTSIFLDGVRIAARVKSALPGVCVVFGGPHVSALKGRILESFPELDVLVVGEGEKPLAELMAAGPDGAAAVKSVVFRASGGDPVYTGPRDDPPLNLDSLPFPAYEKLEGFPRGAYRLPMFTYPRAPGSTCVTSRGCPYSCSYCDRSVFGASYRYNSAEYMVEHVLHLRNRFGLRHVLFYDDQFTLDRARVESFCRRMAAESSGLTFSCAVRAEHVDRDLLGLMKAAGFWMVSLGIETGDADLLAGHRKNPDLDYLAGQVRLIKAAGLKVKGLFMMGLPGETAQSVRRSMEYVRSLPLDEVNVARFTPFPGAPLYERIGERGQFDEEWDKMDCLHFQFLPEGLTRVELEGLFKEFYRGWFLRPRTMLMYARRSVECPDSWRRLMGSLPSFARFARHGSAG